jgi:hypothetical protein
MGDALKIVLYSLFNIYNEGENAGQGCGSLLLVALIGGSLFIALIAQSSLPDMFKIIVFGLLLVLCLVALVWMIYQTIKQWWQEHINNNNKDEKDGNS